MRRIRCVLGNAIAGAATGRVVVGAHRSATSPLGDIARSARCGLVVGPMASGEHTMSRPTLVRLTDDNYMAWRSASFDYMLASGRARALQPAPKGALSLVYTLRRLEAPDDVIIAVEEGEPVPSSRKHIVLAPAAWDKALAWATDQASAVAALRLAMTDDIRSRVADIITLSALWDALDERFAVRSQAMAARAARDVFGARLEDGEDPVKYFDRLDNARERLAMAGHKITDGLYITQLINSLPESLSSTAQTLNASPGLLLTLSHVRNTVVAAYVDMGETRAAGLRAKALAAAASSSSSAGKTCDHCHKQNHTIDQCFVLHPELLAARREKSKGGKAKSATSTSTEIVQYTGPTASSSSSYRASAGSDPLLVARASRSSSRRAPTKPHLDSGANRTFFHSRGVFLTYEAFSPPRRIEVANGVFSPAVGIGLVTLVSEKTGERLELPGTWHAPEFVVDLVSTDTLSALGYDCAFGAESRCFIQRAGRVILEGKHSVLDATAVLAADMGSPSILGQAHAAISIQTLHHRLGHPSYDAVEELIKSKAVDGVQIKGAATMDVGDDVKCVACVLGKAHKSSHPPSERKVTKPGELMVFDLVGPISPPTINGERYHLDGVDVYSKAKFTWLLKRKDECEGKIEAFVAEWARSKVGIEAITLRYDLGSEVGSQAFRDRLAKGGIRFERAARQSPQQIGHAERSHRAVGESAATLLAATVLADLKLPRFLWGFSVVTATYVGNFVPRTGTNGKSPIELFSGRRPDISHLRVPFCEAYPLKLKSDRKFKYEPKAFDGVFIGYGHLDGFKAYYIYIRSSRKVILSCDVMFREAPLVEASRRSTFDPPIAPDRPVELSPAINHRPVDLAPVPDRHSVAMPPSEPVQGPSDRDQPAEIVVPEPAAVESLVESSPEIDGDGLGPEWGLLPVEAAVGAPASPPLAAAPIPDGANLIEESPLLDDYVDYKVPLRDEPLSPSPAPRPPTPHRPPSPQPDPDRSPSPDPLLIKPGADEVYRKGSWYRIPPKPRRAPAPSSSRPPWRNVGSAKLADAVVTTTSSIPAEYSRSLSRPPVPRDGSPVVDTLRALVARPGGHDGVLRDADIVVSDAVKDGRPGDFLLSSEAVPDDIDAAYAADTGPAIAAAAYAAQAIGPHGPAPGARWKSVLNHSHPELWIAAANKEIDAQVENESWEPHAVPPPEALIVDSLWVHVWKYGAEGELKAKSRLVAQGQTQVEGVHFDGSALYVPSVSREGLRAFFAIAVALGLYIHLVDFCTAYLNGVLACEIYMRTPDGFVDRFGPYVKLLRTIYGLRQAGRAWYELLHNLLVELDFECVNVAFGIYRCVRADGHVIFIAIYVDDLPMAGSCLDWMAEIKRKLAARFKMTDIGPLKRVLGIQVDYDREAGVLRMHMGDYIDSVLDRHGMASCKGVGAPIGPGHQLGQPDDLLTADPTRSRDFLKAVGEILWLSQTVHAELAFVASLLARYAGKPTNECWRIMHRVHRYLRRASHAALEYRRQDQATGLLGYVDADWGGCPATARSTGAFFFFFNGMLVSWGSKRQPDVANSSLVAETIAAFFAVYSGLNEVRWLRTALAPLGFVFDEPTELRCDNLGAVQWASGIKHHSKVRHIHYRYHSVREWVARKLIVLKHIGTADQLADIGTKPLGTAHFIELASRLGLDFG